MEDKIMDRVARQLEKSNFAAYVELLNRPWKLFWVNFLAGTARGLGTAVGMTAVFAIVIFVLINLLKSFVQVPILGAYIAQLVEFVNAAVKR